MLFATDSQIEYKKLKRVAPVETQYFASQLYSIKSQQDVRTLCKAVQGIDHNTAPNHLY